ncbi:hypothetical protein DVH26_26255 [Paenibacillus sp. H1-7]|uniref:hypothetical protein n=1 Tax=Paenibacillus sp. H1-7 TaxID=2282849 RepID=UPI001EF78CD9|nr:hypothetical protein [Paenibacillus sp. H1-7]ULL17650.1 hypothetical protein DVH26_26255 [Paenibacillus sp. H1-7]
MNIIEFLLKNWFILAIIFIVLNNIWKNVKARSGDGGNKSAPKQSMPPFGGGGSGSGGWGKPVKQQPAVTKTRQPVVRSEQPKEAREPRLQEMAKGPQTVDNGVSERDKRRESSREALRTRILPSERWGMPSEPKQEGSLQPIKQDTLAQAVVWAEILGPPRAKKPYGKK